MHLFKTSILCFSVLFSAFANANYEGAIPVKNERIVFLSHKGWVVAASTRLIANAYGVDFGTHGHNTLLGIGNPSLSDVEEIRLGVTEEKSGYVDQVEIVCLKGNAILMALKPPFEFKSYIVKMNMEEGHAYGAAVSIPVKSILEGCVVKDISMFGRTTNDLDFSRVRVNASVPEKRKNEEL